MIKQIQGHSVGVFGLINLLPIKVEEFTKKIKEIEKETQTSIQVFNPIAIAGHEHIFHASYLALKAFKQKTNISPDLAMELLIYVSGRKQIQEAIKVIGIKENSTQTVIAIISDSQEKIKNSITKILKSMRASINNKIVNEISNKKLRELQNLFNISENELKALEAIDLPRTVKILKQLILERVALVDLEKD